MNSVALTINPVQGGFYTWHIPEGDYQCIVESCIEELSFHHGFRRHELLVDIGRECQGI